VSSHEITPSMLRALRHLVENMNGEALGYYGADERTHNALVRRAFVTSHAFSGVFAIDCEGLPPSFRYAGRFFANYATPSAVAFIKRRVGRAERARGIW
jgi:hypothetical protein